MCTCFFLFWANIFKCWWSMKMTYCAFEGFGLWAIFFFLVSFFNVQLTKMMFGILILAKKRKYGPILLKWCLIFQLTSFFKKKKKLNKAGRGKYAKYILLVTQANIYIVSNSFWMITCQAPIGSIVKNAMDREQPFGAFTSIQWNFSLYLKTPKSFLLLHLFK